MKEIIRKIEWWFVRNNFFKYTFVEQPFVYLKNGNYISKEPTNKIKWLEKEISIHCYYKDVHNAVWNQIKDKYPAHYKKYMYLF